MRQCTLLIVLQSTFMKRLFKRDGFNKLQPRPWGSRQESLSLSPNRCLLLQPRRQVDAVPPAARPPPWCSTPHELLPNPHGGSRAPRHPQLFAGAQPGPPSPGTILSLPQKMENTANPSAICAFAAFPLRHLTALQTACPHAFGLICFCYTLRDFFHSKTEVWDHFLRWTCFLPFEENLWLFSYQVWILFYYFKHRIIHSGSMNIRNYHTRFCAPFAEHMDNCCLSALAPLQGSEQTCNISI